MNNYYKASIMSSSELLRNRLFFAADSILKKGIKEHLKDIEVKMAGADSLYDMNKLLKHAVDTVDYYKGFKRAEELGAFPIVNKTTIRENIERFLSNKYSKEEIYTVTTSGSHGTPMRFYRTKEKKIRQIAEVLYFGRQTNFYFGMQRGFIRATHPKGKLSSLIQNEIHIDPTKIDEKFLEDIRQKLKAIKVIIGFPSTLFEIAQYCLKKGDTPDSFNLKGIIATAEPLLDNQRELIEKAFGCPLHARYATEELGLIAVQDPKNLYYRVNEATFHVEVLKLDSDEPCEEGEEGRIVVTDLYSYAMPLIRYDTGDLGTYKIISRNDNEEMFLTSISGRKIEMVLSPIGEKISPFSINVKMKDAENVKRFQFIQKGENFYLMKLIVDESYSSDQQVINILKEVLGEEANIRIEKVETIPTLPSGKTPYIINEYKTVKQ